eukprot:TRINITY_DN13960_c0_g1_i3.p1 TRINITY_DN13960_c0_g1~~TRINITY_DN13960_c0_g1_i3.p1  ORF type:complete len:163 (+),score=15.18 TRINITY_DN13960_c0_g1_i3:60-548(+)
MREGKDVSCVARRRVVYDVGGYKGSCPMEAAMAEYLEGILHPPRPQVKEGEVIAAGVRDIRKLKQIRAKAITGCPQCAAYRSVRSCAYCAERPRADVSAELDEEAAPFYSRIERPIEYEDQRVRSLPAAILGIEVRLPTAPKPTTVRPHSLSSVSKRRDLQV